MDSVLKLLCTICFPLLSLSLFFVERDNLGTRVRVFYFGVSGI